MQTPEHGLAPEVDPLTLLLTGQLPFLLILAVLLSAVASFVLLGIYKRAVLRSMRSGAETRAASAATGEHPPATRSDVLTVSPGASGEAWRPAGPPPTADFLYRNAIQGPWRTAGVYAAAGLAFAMVMAACTLVSAGTPLSLWRVSVLVTVFAWPVTITANRVALSRRSARLALTGAYFVVLAAVGAVTIARSPAFGWGQLATLWLICNLPPTILVLAFLSRRIRAVGSVVLILMLLAVTGAAVAFWIAASDDRLVSVLTYLGTTADLSGRETIAGLLLFGSLFIGGPIGWLMVRWLGKSYERKAISDQSLMVDSIWLLFGVVQSIGLAFEGAWWVLSGVVAFMAFKAVAWLGFAMLRAAAPPAARAPRLLLLRVFSLGRRSERLFDGLAMHWRHVGSIQLIAGPDLATTTVEPHEFLDFLARRLDRRFIDSPDTLALRLGEMDLEPDRDGRYRVHDFYCYDDTWTMVLRRLVRDSGVILMDLRGFSAQNAGCLFEIKELIDVAPLERVRILVDGSTDKAFLHDSVRQFWNALHPDSPNRELEAGQLPLMRLGGHGTPELARLIRDVCESAAPAGRALGQRGLGHEHVIAD